MRALALHYPNDPAARVVTDQYLLGPDVLVAPVLDEHAVQRDVYLPEGTWLPLWTNKTYDQKHGENLSVPAPIGNPPIFLRANTPDGDTLRSAVARAGLMG